MSSNTADKSISSKCLFLIGGGCSKISSVCKGLKGGESWKD